VKRNRRNITIAEIFKGETRGAFEMTLSQARVFLEQIRKYEYNTNTEDVTGHEFNLKGNLIYPWKNKIIIDKSEYLPPLLIIEGSDLNSLKLKLYKQL
jgi:hypothetical protein